MPVLKYYKKISETEGTWDAISTLINLNDYYTKTNVNAILNTYYDKNSVDGIVNSKIGDTTTLNTNEKKVVNAINEVKDSIGFLNDLICGTNNFSSNVGTIVTHNAGTNIYKVIITPSSLSDGNIGDYWVENKTSTSFTVKNSGANKTVAFDWILIRRSTFCGTNTFAGCDVSPGRTITHNAGTTSYKVIITPSSSSDGSIGEYYIDNKTATSFSVKNTGSNKTINFDWLLIK